VLIPGDPEREKEEKMRIKGISILPSIVEEMKEIAKELGVEFSSEE
jgi:LDH2 family malate/lactate/ureidoglycolate dehydrogenase